MHVLFDIAVKTLVKAVGLVMLLSILLQIGSRLVLKVPFPWTDELSRGSFLWFCFLGSALAMRQNAHLGIDYFRSKLGEKGQWLSDLAVSLTVVLFGAIVCYLGWRLLGVVGRQRTPILRISMQWFYLAVPLTGALLALQGFEFFVKYLATGKPRPPLEEPTLPPTGDSSPLF